MEKLNDPTIAGFKFRVIPTAMKVPDLLEPSGVMKLVSASTLDGFEKDSLRLWCHHYARYLLPTTELIDWLKDFINGRKTIEIGSGNGDLAHHLGIPATDNKMQTLPDVAAFYAATGQPTIKYPIWVKKIDALSAVKKYSPEVVIGSWITHWIDPNKPMPEGGGNMYGVKEDLLLQSDVTYIMIGNLHVHRYKPILKLAHEEIELPFLRSRANNQTLDRVFIWNNNGKTKNRS